MPIPFEFNIAQELFAIFYAIFYGTMIATVGWLQPFSTHEAIKMGWHSKAMIRLVVSILLLNLVPLIYFVIFLEHLNFLVIEFPLDFYGYLKVLNVILLTLPVFGFYRVYAGVAVLRWESLYRPEHYEALRDKRVKQYSEATTGETIRINQHEKNKTVFDDWLTHFMPGIFYVVIPTVLYLLVSWNLLSVLVGVVFIGVLVAIWMAIRN